MNLEILLLMQPGLMTFVYQNTRFCSDIYVKMQLFMDYLIQYFFLSLPGRICLVVEKE